jgi:hypothetical protein
MLFSPLPPPPQAQPSVHYPHQDTSGYTRHPIDVSNQAGEAFRRLGSATDSDLLASAFIRSKEQSTLGSRDVHAQSPTSAASNTLLSDTQQRRIALLAEKYAGKAWEPEMEARLEIDNRRISKIVPRVTDEMVDALNEFISEIESDNPELEAMLKELGVE